MVALSKCKNESETIKVQVHTDDHKRKCTPAHANSYGSQAPPIRMTLVLADAFW